VGRHAWVDDSLRGLAQRAGIDPDGLERTVALWNEATISGHDPLGRTALDYPVRTRPFYAVLTHGDTIVTPAGVLVDEQLRVCDTGGEPIPGLYAAGEVLGSGATMGAGAAGGMMVTPAMSFGRMLGHRLAEAR
jgi:fumarate reductase flavoprotein subunit